MRRFREYIIEAINNPPHMPNRFFEEYQKAFQQVENFLKNLPDVNQLEWVRDIISRSKAYDIEEFLDHLRYLSSHLNSSLPVSERIADMMQADSNRVQKYLTSLHDILQRVLPIIDQLRELSPQMQSYIKRLYDEIEENKQFFDGADLPTYEQAIKNINDLQNVVQNVNWLVEWYPSFQSGIKAFLDRMHYQSAKYYGGELPKFNDNELETLYHTTTAASSILREGFKTRAELGRGALGGGPDDLISFTSDLRIAEAIVWCLRRAVDIAQGRLNYEGPSKIISHYGGNLDATVGHTSSGFGQFDTRPTKDASGFFVTGSRSTTPEEQKEWLFQAFKHFLATQDKIYNPVFAFVDVSDFIHVNMYDIGIIAADVEMAKTQYLLPMEEYRVPIDAIHNIRRQPYRGVNFPILKF